VGFELFRAFERPALPDVLRERADLRELLQDYAEENQALRARTAAQAQQIADQTAEIKALTRAARGVW
jgi:hypothetical protein